MTSHTTNEITSLPLLKFHFSPNQKNELLPLLSQGSAKDFYKFLSKDIESEKQQLLALHLIETLLTKSSKDNNAPLLTLETLKQYLTEVKGKAVERINYLKQQSDAEVWISLLRQRALLSLIAGCWLDYVSQPATEPALITCLLSGHNHHIKGEGDILKSQQQQRHRRFAELGISISTNYMQDILFVLKTTELTAWHASFWLALSRLPANYLPEVIGFQYAYYFLGIDDAMLDLPPPLQSEQLEELLESYFALCVHSQSGQNDVERLLRAIQKFVGLELEHSEMLVGLQEQLIQRTLDDRMIEIIRRHFPFAGKQHQSISLGQRPLSQWLETDEKIKEFLTTFKHSPYLKLTGSGSCSFAKAFRFGGSMFGIFNEHEAEIMARWIKHSQDSDSEVQLTSMIEAGSQYAENWFIHSQGVCLDHLIIWQSAEEVINDRELFYRLVNIENFPNQLNLIKRRIVQVLVQAEILFEIGQHGQYTDASYFSFSKEALEERTSTIYWTKLINPYERLTEIPDRESVVFNQKLMALGSMIDGAWAHKIGGTLRYYRNSDGMMLAIYADEIGRGDIKKNHITLIHRVLKSMGISLPHIRHPDFRNQSELPDIYDFSLYQLGISLFPDTFYEELLGYNLGIEMFGLGEMRMHEIQKLQYYDFDTIYEAAHLTIDNFSAGHARQSVDLIVSYLDEISSILTKEELQQHWRRIWLGYASFAYFLETELIKQGKFLSQEYGEVLI